MRRRQFLAGTAAASGAVAGCAGLARDESPKQTQTATIEPVPADSTPSYQFQQGPRNTGVAAEPLDPDGSWWETQIGPVGQGFAAADERVVAAETGVVHAFDAATGDQLWEESLGGVILGVPALADDTAYVPFPYIGPRPLGGIAAVDLTDGSLRLRAIPRVDVMESPTLTDDRVFAIGGEYRDVVLAVDAKTGKFQWQHQIGEYAPPPAVADGTVFVGGGTDNAVYALDAATGEKQWETPLSGAVDIAPTVVGETVFVGAVDEYTGTGDGSDEGTLHALSTGDGKERWRVTLGESLGEGMAATSDALYVPVDSSMVALDTAGEQLWRTELPAPPTPPTVAGDALVTGAADVFCLDVADGSERWRHPVRPQTVEGQHLTGIDATPAVTDGTVYGASKAGLVFECGNPDALG